MNLSESVSDEIKRCLSESSDGLDGDGKFASVADLKNGLVAEGLNVDAGAEDFADEWRVEPPANYRNLRFIRVGGKTSGIAAKFLERHGVRCAKNLAEVNSMLDGAEMVRLYFSDAAPISQSMVVLFKRGEEPIYYYVNEAMWPQTRYATSMK